MKNVSLLLLIVFMACSPKGLMNAEYNQWVSKSDINPADYEMLSYVDINSSTGLSMNNEEVEVFGLCQSLFTAHAFSGTIVLSAPKKVNSETYSSVEKEIKDCHFKFLQLQSLDLYDKTYDQLSAKAQGVVQELFELKLIRAKVN